MAVSGTVSQTVFNTRKIIDHAFRKCRLPPEGVGGEQMVTAQETLYLLLSALANRGLQLWCIEKLILPFQAANAEVPVGNGIVDLLNTNYRTVEAQTGVTTVTNSSYTVAFASPTSISTVGLLYGSSVSSNYLVQTSTNGTTWTTLLVMDAAGLANKWIWKDVPVPITTSYIRVFGYGTGFAPAQFVFGNTPNEIPMARLNRDSYANLPNKAFQGKPLQFWLDRTLDEPIMYVWPVPSASTAIAQVTTYVKRYIMDVGTLTQEIEVPQRWYEAIVYQLAARFAEELPQVDPAMMPILDQKAMRALNEAEMEERDNSPIYFTPNIAVYTR